MNSNKQPVDLFKEYADRELKNHLTELKTRYENESAGEDTLKKAFGDHKTIYSKELEQKIKDLSKNDASQEAKLNALKKEYVDKLTAGRF